MRPVVSTPTACNGVFADGDILTNFQAGGMTNSRIRSRVVSSFICFPIASKYLKPRDFEPLRFHHFARRPFSTMAKSRAPGFIVRSTVTCPSMFVKASIANRIVLQETINLVICKYCRYISYRYIEANDLPANGQRVARMKHQISI